MKKEADYFEGSEPQLIYIARKLKDALRLEELLTRAGIDYGVEPDEFQGGVIFRTTRVGAFFYVLPEIRDAVAALLVENGYVPAASVPAASVPAASVPAKE